MFKLTPAAAEQVLKAAKEGNAEGLSLRLAAAQKPDGAIEYRMGFEDAVQEDDIRFQSEGVDLVMAPEDVPLLDQATMDYAEVEPGKMHFIFLNPKDLHYKPPSQ
ncbi:MAG: iron-sulfur cluster assembly accessory protein [Thiohalocapsa sp.]|jgi:iron-sulfur cluster assembly protein|uniref:HesB/IscA family protein n=1 Tax=Thiohalocapsa sp. TaxID=2497641 RepID=UPI0025D14A17|nr:iron-sulfur cluster assembly accessory protein [Thiohalocapsa sp.]MCG6941760.1 iron-sulfur cluster assembly accessory protein [Thiohalocapsa sp.]